MSERMSAHTRTVLGVLSERRCHLTAEEILEKVDGIGTATVYRALDTLTENGKIRRLSLGKKSAVYEYTRDAHMHFVCSGCGAICDIRADLSGMIREAARCSGHEVEWSEITAHGLCSACLRERETAADDSSERNDA
ncbi:MAG: Fur family transcriptional regulator [Candidatus Ventricola sp.]